MITNFIEIEKHLQNARFELASGKSTATLMALLKATEQLSLEVRNHIQGRTVPIASITQADPSFNVPISPSPLAEAYPHSPV